MQALGSSREMQFLGQNHKAAKVSQFHRLFSPVKLEVRAGNIDGLLDGVDLR